jgi:hypothetical protein
MKNILIIFPVLAIVLLQSCAPTMDYTWSQDNFKEQKINKIAVVVVSKNQAIRQSVESEIASDLRAEGIDAITSISTFLPVNASKEDWTTDAIAKQLEKLGCDAAIGISLINQKDRTNMFRGNRIIRLLVITDMDAICILTTAMFTVQGIMKTQNNTSLSLICTI